MQPSEYAHDLQETILQEDSRNVYIERALNDISREFYENLGQKIPDVQEREVKKFHEFCSIFRTRVTEGALAYVYHLPKNEKDCYMKFICSHIRESVGRSVEDNRPMYMIDNEFIVSDIAKNYATYMSVRGYGSDELIHRKSTGLPPRPEEILLGCYEEQLERHTRNAVLVLRRKGYPTIGSGYYRKDIGSQYFHIDSNTPLIIPDAFTRRIYQEFGVRVVSCFEEHEGRQYAYVEFIPTTSFIDLKTWEKILDAFAQEMPRIGDSPHPPAVGLVYQFFRSVTQTFSKEEILQNTCSEKEREYVEALYACSSDEELQQFVGVSDVSY